MSAPKKTPFVSGGHMLEKPPLSTQVIRWMDRIYLFFGLYIVSLFALDSYAAAESSQFNIAASHNQAWTRPRWSSNNNTTTTTTTTRRNLGGGDRLGGSGATGRRPYDRGNGGGSVGGRVRGLNDVQEGPTYMSGCGGGGCS